MSLTFIVFGLLSILAIASAVVTVAGRHPVKSAMALIFHFFMLAGLYLTLNAQFLAVIQLLVYAGAIMVLVVFVILLLNLGTEEQAKLRLQARQSVGLLLSGAFIVLLAAVLLANAPRPGFNPDVAYMNGSPRELGKELFTHYLFPFEAVSVLLLVAIIGAVVLAKHQLKD